MVTALHNHFALQIQAACRYRRTIETTICNAKLPPTIRLSVHDAASAFKRFISEIPGGILGSLYLFDAICAAFPLPPVHLYQERSPRDKVDAGRVAQAILGLHCSDRAALVTAVFGLLAYFRREVGPPSDGSMSARALGIVFAPLLLGSLTDGIPVHREYIRAKGYPGACENSYNLATSLQRLNIASTVVEMLIVSWEEVVWNIRCMQPAGGCYLPWPSTPNPLTSVSHPGAQPHPLRRVRGDSGILIDSDTLFDESVLQDPEETTVCEEDLFVTALSTSSGSRTASYHSVFSAPRQGVHYGFSPRPPARAVRSFSLPLLSSRSQLCRD